MSSRHHTSSVDSIAYSYGCYNLNRIYISSIDSWCKIRFSGAFLDYYLYLDNNLLTELVIPGYLSEVKYATFGNCLSLKTLSIEEGIKSIGNYSFGYCENLTSIILPNSLNYVNREAFCYLKSINDIFCYAENVPTSGYDVFLESPINKATLHVPASSIEAYKRTNPWSRFGNIVALTDNDPKPTGVNALKVDNNVYPDNTFIIEGRRISNPQRGMNIIRMSDGTIKKVIKK